MDGPGSPQQPSITKDSPLNIGRQPEENHQNKRLRININGIQPRYDEEADYNDGFEDNKDGEVGREDRNGYSSNADSSSADNQGDRNDGQKVKIQVQDQHKVDEGRVTVEIQEAAAPYNTDPPTPSELKNSMFLQNR